MCPNPVDLDTALSELRAEHPSQAARASLLATLRRPSRNPRPKALAAAALIIVGAVSLWPRESQGLAWAQTRMETSRVTRLHQTWYRKDGTLAGERWVDGPRWASYDLSKGDQLWFELRTDGRREFIFIGNRSQTRSVNARPVATIRTLRAPHSPYASWTTVDQLLKGKSKVLSQETVTTEDGERVKYRISVYPVVKYAYTVYAEPDTGRITRTVSQFGEECRIDYPERIPDHVFDPAQPMVKGVEIHDMDAERPKLSRMMRQGLGESKGIRLRCVALDGYGSLWAMWTGWLPDGKLTRPIRITGVPCSAPYGTKMYTSSYNLAKMPKPPMIGGKRIGGMGVTPKVVIGDRLKEVVIPGENGNAVFRNVPVFRVASLYALGLD